MLHCDALQPPKKDFKNLEFSLGGDGLAYFRFHVSDRFNQCTKRQKHEKLGFSGVFRRRRYRKKYARGGCSLQVRGRSHDEFRRGSISEKQIPEKDALPLNSLTK